MIPINNTLKSAQRDNDLELLPEIQQQKKRIDELAKQIMMLSRDQNGQQALQDSHIDYQRKDQINHYNFNEEEIKKSFKNLD